MENFPEALCWFLALKERLGIFELNKTFDNVFTLSFPYVVQDGPFRGMEYKCDSIWGSKYPKLVGSYEFELQPIVRYLFQKKFDTVINIGAAEGYYAVGWATGVQELCYYCCRSIGSRSKGASVTSKIK